MNKWILIFLGLCSPICYSREPFKASKKAIPYLVYFTSRYRGICVGTLVSRSVVMTAAICVTNPISRIPDTRPLNVVAGTLYRHPRRGIRVQVKKILLPKLPVDLKKRANILAKTPALLMMKKNVPDILAEVPLRPIHVDWTGEEILTLQEECLITGWHFFYKGDKIFPIYKFLLQRNLRIQFMNIVKLHEWCEALAVRLEKSLIHAGFDGDINEANMLCIRDPDMHAQPCHGSYGAPLICRGRVVGMMMAPDGQWSNCTGQSNIIHMFNSNHVQAFLRCVKSLFTAEAPENWEEMKKLIYDEDEDYDYIPSLYGKLMNVDESSSEGN